MTEQRFTAVLEAAPGGGLRVAVPFDPDRVWGAKSRHHVAGTLGGHRIRAVIESGGFTLGPAWARDCPVRAGDTVEVRLAPEGPQRGDLAADVARALAENPKAGEFFDGLAQFYRKAYLKWIDGASRRPGERARRVREMVELLKEGVKQRPKP